MRPTTRFWACAILASAALCATTAQGAAPKYSAIYVFGDSYCDVGNIYIATKKAIPASPPYYKGRFSNGPIWVEKLAGALGLTMKPALAGGTDYAFGGAYAATPEVTSEGTIPDVPQQVGLYLKEHDGKADPHALYILEGGGNDILGAIAKGGGSASRLGFDIATAISESEILRRAGAKNFLIPNLFNVGILPAAAANRKFALAVSEAANSSLNDQLEIESFLEGVKIERLNTYGLIEAIEADPSHFGFKNLTTPCLNSVTDKVCSDPDRTFFWDVEHPTEPVHSDFAVAALTVLDK